MGRWLMPYSGASDPDLPKNVKKMSASKRAQWVEVFNSSIKSGDSESTAFAKANGVVKTKGLIDDWYDVDSRQLSQVEAQYTPYGANSEGGCANCRWFVSPDSCLLVWGDISPTGKSKLWYNGASQMLESESEPEVKESGPIKKALQSVAKALGLSGEATQATPTDAPVRPMLFVKGADGELRFFTAFTNCFKDSHGEIITQQAHRDYVYWATVKEQYPELQLWHCGPSTKFGQVDWLDYADGFVLASGVIDADKEYIAEAIAKEDVKVSHGFYGVSNDANEIVAYRTFEISVLPASQAANQYTSFNIAKEIDMGLTPAKRDWLKTVGKLSEEAIVEIETNVTKMSDNLKALGIEYKEAAEDNIGAEVATYAKASSALAEVVLQLKQASDQQAAAIEALKAEFTKSIADQVETAFLAKVAQTPNGHVATESKENIVTKEKAENDFSWLAKFITK